MTPVNRIQPFPLIADTSSTAAAAAAAGSDDDDDDCG